MKTKVLYLFVLLSAALVSVAARGEDPPKPASAENADNGSVYFLDDVMPLVNRLGCNLAKCHGSQMGKGGLKLSMFGAEPKDDYLALTKSVEGRRVNRVEPQQSLFLLKATASVSHEGKQLVKPGSAEYTLLASWVAQGARWADAQAPELVRIKVSPEKQLLKQGGSQSLAVTAVYSDGTEKDVTGGARFQSSDESVAVVDKGGKVEARGHGQCAIVVTHMRRAGAAVIVVPQSLPNPFPEVKPNNGVDEHVLAKLKELGIPPSELCSDQVFLRRVYLDTVGTLPTADQAREFLADADPQKRSKLIDKLLASDEFADYWALKWGDLLRVKSEYPSNLWPNAVQAYHHWIRDSIAHNKPYDQFARELLTASGSNFRNPPANYFRALLKRDPQSIAEVTALVFMGARVGCARCHGHPVESWGLDDDLGLAAFFAQVRYKRTQEWKEEIVYVSPGQTLRHPKTGEVVKPKFLDGDVVELSPEKDPRVEFARWLTAPENPWFARNIVNRTWFWLLGRGIIHEVDDLRSTNPPENPELLAYLEKELTSHNYDLKHIYRLILNSRTYQTSSKANEWNGWDTAHFSHYQVKRLGAETLLDAIGQVTERWDTYQSRIPEPFVKMPTPFRATHLADGSIGVPFLQLFGRPPRDTAYESDRDLKLSMRQTLHLLNSTDVQNKINASPRLRQLLKEHTDDAELVKELYLAVLSRGPTEAEAAATTEFLSGKSKAALEQALAEKKSAEEALAKVKGDLEKAKADYEAAEKEAEAASPEKRRLAEEAKARRDKLAADEKAAGAKLAVATKKVNAAGAPRTASQRQQALQDLLWALLNTKEFLFNH